jgi:hypothetical protein
VFGLLGEFLEETGEILNAFDEGLRAFGPPQVLDKVVAIAAETFLVGHLGAQVRLEVVFARTAEIFLRKSEGFWRF